jgi:23S rRNA pseudouridine1911/1915/1917 synthase
MIRVIYEDEAILVVEKPAGVQAQESKGFGKDMVSEIKKYLAKKGLKDLYVGVVHRLDQPVKGVMVYGKTREATAALSKQMAEAGHMDKEYLALVCGKPAEDHARLVDHLYFDRASNTSRVVIAGRETARIREESKEAALDYQVEEAFTGHTLREQLQAVPDAPVGIFKTEVQRLFSQGLIGDEEELTLLRVQLLTGRHHQIRVQLAYAGLPLLGDVRYNPAMQRYRGLPALCLCAKSIAFDHPISKKMVTFSL